MIVKFKHVFLTLFFKLFILSRKTCFNTEKDDFNQQTASKAPICRSKFTTLGTTQEFSWVL